MLLASVRWLKGLGISDRERPTAGSKPTASFSGQIHCLGFRVRVKVREALSKPTDLLRAFAGPVHVPGPKNQ